MRAVERAETGLVERPDGVRIAYEVFGAGEPTILLLPSTPIVHSRQWKAQALTVRCPMIVVHGTDDRCQPSARARRLHELTGAPLVMVEGGGHMLPGRQPVLVNLVIRDFVRSLAKEAVD